MLPILSKSVGGDKPQYPAAKSTRFRRCAIAPCWQCMSRNGKTSEGAQPAGFLITREQTSIDSSGIYTSGIDSSGATLGTILTIPPGLAQQP